jgi:hypothetical protein
MWLNQQVCTHAHNRMHVHIHTHSLSLTKDSDMCVRAYLATHAPQRRVEEKRNRYFVPSTFDLAVLKIITHNGCYVHTFELSCSKIKHSDYNKMAIEILKQKKVYIEFGLC